MQAALESIRRGAVELFTQKDLEEKLALKNPLRVKLGVDPTSPDLHLGHAVVLHKLRTFQDLGHHAVLILGDFTAQVGDPSGRDKTRPALSFETIEKNAQTYQSQAFKILDPAKTEIRFNSEWLAPVFRVERAIEAGSPLQAFLTRYSVLRLLEREEFTQRRKQELPITLAEILYPLFQAYDSVAVKADVEIGGNDQLFNLLMGRQMQKDFSQPPQVVLTLPLLEGTDGVKKMSKSYGNYIALEEAPADMFGKAMSLSDPLMLRYYELLTDADLSAVKALHPKQAKLDLSERLVKSFHGAEAAREARAEFERVFSRKEIPSDIPSFRLPRTSMTLVEVMVESQTAPSKNEARRLLKQRAVRVKDRVCLADEPLEIAGEAILQVGKRQFRKLLPPE
ncbi:MAG: tyrosine--tRNA ligase [Elusimicrobia bacterium]|nr:tyrosine--tRNA ligase [Elusimicrobiota bacterium]